MFPNRRPDCCQIEAPCTQGVRSSAWMDGLWVLGLLRAASRDDRHTEQCRGFILLWPPPSREEPRACALRALCSPARRLTSPCGAAAFAWLVEGCGPQGSSASRWLVSSQPVSLPSVGRDAAPVPHIHPEHFPGFEINLKRGSPSGSEQAHHLSGAEGVCLNRN